MSGTAHPASASMSVEVPVIDHATDPVHAAEPPADPAALAAGWLPGPDADRMLMTLSTVSPEGVPHARTVMLSDFDGVRFSFHTDASSRKVADLAVNPRVALTILWPGFTRQLVVEGLATRASDTAAARAYARRSPYLRQLAWMNTDEVAGRPLAQREEGWARFAAEHPDPEPPAGWVGFTVAPERWLFWVSHPGAPSRRIEYTRSGAGWSARPLPG
ncbi:pyridoxamine 5'-phosphate oxidase family protein [Microbacterium aquimaris]|uniref:Pyridoxamine 5'-phosphate oxidase family protein n=1 Tax=Microbacterium aquimaris TaxID=459816 RepID=A0ABU5N698_9MICO|nr:pyridoxamine 5'-phosphate oxidase family protein [Microbacterium aquimaris]MDZ8161472.1 pyridoxamine 5'-phosphate oxidase family protein [Microbacterium aquimaris]